MYDFESNRLGFRRWREADKLPFSIMNSDPKVMEYFPNMLTKEQSDEFVDRINNHFCQYGYGLWAVEVKETNEFIGFIGFFTATFESSFTPCIEIGWRLSGKYWNNGYATEGAKECLQYGFHNLGMNEIYSFTSFINKPSINVMKKIGLQEECTFLHPKIDESNPLCLHVLYKIDKTTYERN